MLIKITSKNPNFSYAIAKNPNSPPKLKELRSGYLFGWFSSPDAYCVRFIDSPDENSFKESQFDEFSYLDTECYSSPAIPLRIISQFFPKIFAEHDLEHDCELKVYSVNIADQTLGRVKNSFPSVDIEENGGFFDITFKSSSIDRLLKEADLFFMFICCKKYNYFVDFTEKYLKRIVELDAPYFVRYVIKNALVRNSVNKWEIAAPFINSSKKWNFQLQKLNNQEARRKFAKTHATGGSKLIDFGCGGGQFLGLAKLYDSYIGVDTDPKALEKAKSKAKSKHITNCEFLSELPDVTGADVLMIEVLEHLNKEEQIALMAQLKSANKVILTTPNRDFNQFYGIESRREDHLNELSLDELKSLIGVNGEYYQLGDTVNDIATITGCILK